MHHDSGRLLALQDLQHLRVRLPAVNDQGKIPLTAEPDVLDEDPPLDFSWRIILRVVEARLSHRNDVRVGGQRAEVRHRLRPGAPCFMGWTATAACTVENRPARSTAARLDATSMPTVTMPITPACRARSITAARSAANASSSRCTCESNNSTIS